MFELLLVVLAILVWMLIKLLRNEAVFIPLPKNTVRQMLRLANVKRTDVLYDLGAGDGRVVKIAAKEFGCRAVGIEKNRILCWFARRNVAPATRKIKIICGNFFNQDISDATVVAIYLSAKINEQLKAKLKHELKKGTRIVSASHVFKGWKEVKKIKTGHFYSYLYKI